MYKLSIIIISYNNEEYLSRCLDSVKNFNSSEIEVIIIDNGSNDESRNRIIEFKNSHFSELIFLFPNDNLFTSGAIEYGYAYSKGKYLIFLSSDDFINDETIKKFIKHEYQKNLDLYFFDYVIFNRKESKYYKTVSDVNFDDNLEELRRNLLIKDDTPFWSVVYKRDIFENNLMRYDSGLTYEDLYLNVMRVLIAKRMIKINEPIISYWKGDVSLSRSFNNINFMHRKYAYEKLRHIVNLKKFYKYRDEINFNIFRFYYWSTSRGLLEKFFPIQYNEFLKIRKEFNDNFKYFELNYYYANFLKLSVRYRVFIFLFRNNPKIIFIFYYLKGLLKKTFRIQHRV